MSLRQQVDSLEYVKVKVDATVNGSAHDPTGDTVQMAFTDLYDDPVSDNWKSADWETISGKYYARCLVGPGGTVTLASGSYVVWVKITDDPEIPILRSGTLVIY